MRLSLHVLLKALSAEGISMVLDHHLDGNWITISAKNIPDNFVTYSWITTSIVRTNGEIFNSVIDTLKDTTNVQIHKESVQHAESFST